MGILAGRGWAEAPAERATVQQANDGTHCHVRFRSSSREIACDEVASAIKSELHVPTTVQLILQPSKGTRYEDVARLIESLWRVG
jgi:hypothetical protein